MFIYYGDKYVERNALALVLEPQPDEFAARIAAFLAPLQQHRLTLLYTKLLVSACNRLHVKS